MHLPYLRILIPLAFVLCVLAVHLRGRKRLKFSRQLFDHSALFAPYNLVMYGFSAVPGRAFVDPNTMPSLAPLAANWTTIRDEAKQLLEAGDIRASDRHDDASFNSFFKQGWKRFYLKWYGDALPSAGRACPRTVALVDAIPEVKAAMFALLPPGSKLNPHRDPFAGSLRYHLGLITPNSDACNITVDGETYSWRDGEPVVFDETFVHWAENTTDQTRVILFCDVERPLRTGVMRAVNRAVSRVLGHATASPNDAAEPVGAVNRLYAALHRSGETTKRWRKRYPVPYRVAKYALIAIVLYAIVLW